MVLWIGPVRNCIRTRTGLRRAAPSLPANLSESDRRNASIDQGDSAGLEEMKRMLDARSEATEQDVRGSRIESAP